MGERSRTLLFVVQLHLAIGQYQNTSGPQSQREFLQERGKVTDLRRERKLPQPDQITRPHTPMDIALA